MINRTLEELHDPKIGHCKFAKICDLLIKENYQITNIKEFYESFKFTINNREYNFRKKWKASAKEFVNYFKNLVKMENELEKRFGEQK